MLGYTVYNQSGGQAKTTVSRDLAAAHAEIGDQVLVIDMDSQNGSLSNYFGVDDTKHDPNTDDLTYHMINKGQGPFRDVIQEAEPGIDVVPSHKRMVQINDYLTKAADYEGMDKGEDWEYNAYEQLLNVIKKESLSEDYDVLIIDPNAKADILYYMSIYATRNVVIPAIPTRSGYESIQGVAASAKGIAEELDINIGQLAVVPTMIDMRKKSNKEYALSLKGTYDAPVYFKSLSAFEGAEDSYQSIFQYLQDRERIRPSEEDILGKYRTLLASIYDILGDPLPPDTWSEGEYYTGDDFWGDVQVPFAGATDEQAPNPQVN